jgi:hypothetical protein
MTYLRLILLLLVLIGANMSRAQTLARQDDEDAEAFVNRIMPEGMALAHHVIETNRWSRSAKMIVACYGRNDTTDRNGGINNYSTIEGHVYLPIGENNYRDITFGPIEEEGGYPEIVSIFFANADKDTTKEMIVLCKYWMKNYDFEGTLYKAFIYDNPTKENKLLYMEDLSRKFFGMEGNWRDGKINKAKYKTAKDIRAKLKQMGY